MGCFHQPGYRPTRGCAVQTGRLLVQDRGEAVWHGRRVLTFTHVHFFIGTFAGGAVHVDRAARPCILLASPERQPHMWRVSGPDLLAQALTEAPLT